jgi:hypothetical protein
MRRPAPLRTRKTILRPTQTFSGNHSVLKGVLLSLVVVCCFLLSNHNKSSPSSPSSSSTPWDDHDRRSHDGDYDLAEWIQQHSAFDLQLYRPSVISLTGGRGGSPGQQQQSMPCQPHKVHVSPATNVHPVEQTMTMTLSFALDRSTCNIMDDRDGMGSVSVSIVYGRKLFPEGTVEYNQTQLRELATPFEYRSSKTMEDYRSDYIYHIPLPNLLAGQHTYWYRIQVLQKTLPALQQHSAPTGLAAATTTNIMVGQQFIQPYHPSYYLRGSLNVVVGESSTYHFQTPPLYDRPTAIAFVGDLGQTANSTKTMNRILQKSTATTNVMSNLVTDTIRSWMIWNDNDMDGSNLAVPPVSALVIAGDLSYADGEPRRWDRWLEIMEPLLRTLPFLSVPGNHEIECDNTTNHNIFVPYEHWFRNPNRIQQSDVISPTPEYIDTLWDHSCVGPSQFVGGRYDYGNAFYQYKHGLVHIIALNSYTSIVPRSVQYEWLARTALPSVDRTETPWLIVVFHCPLYTTFLGHNHELNSQLMKSSIQDLLKDYKVNLVVSGHDHAYLRTHPVHHDTVDRTNRSPMYWTLGAGGNREGHTRGYIHDVPEEWVAKRDNDEFGFGHFFAPNATHAHLQWVRDDNDDDGTGPASSPSEVVRDSVWIENYYAFDEAKGAGGVVVCN